MLLARNKLRQGSNKGRVVCLVLTCLLQWFWVLVLTAAGVFSLLVLGFPFSVKLCPVLVHYLDLRDLLPG